MSKTTSIVCKPSIFSEYENLLKGFLLLIIFLFPEKDFSQETIEIAGNNSLVITGGAKIINNQSINNSEAINVEKNDVLIEKEITFNNKKTLPKTPISNIKKRESEKTIKKLIDKSKESIKTKIVFNKSPRSEDSFSYSTSILKQGITSHDFGKNIIFRKNDFKILVNHYQTQQNIYFRIFCSKQYENYLFTRPPPFI